MSETLLHRAAEALARADALLIGAGAGMGVDLGLPDFRGPTGFWKAYPACEALGLSFSAMANPQWFARDPDLAWGFYGHRLNLYRATEPHPGFAILKRWADAMPCGGFVATSNVDGQFFKAGFDPDRQVELHGSIHHLQCLDECGIGIFPAGSIAVEVDEATLHARRPHPQCPRCGGLARPNILMFGDGGWDSSRTREQGLRFQSWLDSLNGRRMVVVECGAGTAIPSVRNLCDSLAQSPPNTLIRINPRETQVDPSQIGLALGALKALARIEQLRQALPS